MPITFNNGIANIVGTPGAASGVFADRPNAADVAEGTLYFATDTVAIYQVVAAAWVNYSGGGGSTPNLQQVVNVGNSIFNTSILSASSGGFSAQIDADTFYITDQKTTAYYSFDYIKYSYFTTSNESKLNFTNDSIIITQYNPAGTGFISKGLQLDFNTNTYTFGDLGLENNVGLVVEVGNKFLYTKGTGLFFDYNNLIFTFGDYDGNYNSTRLIIDDTNQRIQTSNSGFAAGIDFLFDQNLYSFGDFAFKNNGQRFTVNDDAQQVYTSNAGIFIDNSIFKTTIGDYDGNNNGTKLIIDDQNLILKTTSNNDNWGIKLDFANYQYSFGNNTGLNNATHIFIDDNIALINFVNDNGKYNFKNIPAYANNAAALAAGLVIGDIYRSSTGGGDTMHIVH